jgi:hypothetical protein
MKKKHHFCGRKRNMSSISFKRQIGIFTLATAFLLFFSSVYLCADEEDHAEAHHLHLNHLGLVFAGTTGLEEGGETHFTLGVDYERRLSEVWGVGVVGELIFAHKTEYLFVFPAYFHVTEKLWFQAALGFEVSYHHHEEENEGNHGEETHTSKETEFLLRIGMGYGFEVGEIIITPTIDFDFFRGHRSLVWGISIGKGF